MCPLARPHAGPGARARALWCTVPPSRASRHRQRQAVRTAAEPPRRGGTRQRRDQGAAACTRAIASVLRCPRYVRSSLNAVVMRRATNARSTTDLWATTNGVETRAARCDCGEECRHRAPRRNGRFLNQRAAIVQERPLEAATVRAGHRFSNCRVCGSALRAPRPASYRGHSTRPVR